MNEEEIEQLKSQRNYWKQEYELLRDNISKRDKETRVEMRSYINRIAELEKELEDSEKPSKQVDIFEEN